jgi:hypothetical protein
MMIAMKTICYLRRGRKLRASGTVIEHDRNTAMVKVKPARDNWGMIWLTQAEIEVGREKPPTKPREKKDSPAPPVAKPQRKMTPKPVPEPRWQQLVRAVRLLEIDHVPEGWPTIKMHIVTALADELEAAQAKLLEFLPMNA